MLEMTHLLTVLKKLFTDQSYGKSLENYIASKNPKTTADVEHLERQWNYVKFKKGQWL